MRNTPEKFRDEEDRLSEGFLSSDTLSWEDYLETHGSKEFKQYIRDYQARWERLRAKGILI